MDLPFPVDEVLRGVDTVFVSHLHSDHFDDVAQQMLPQDVPILCPPAIAQAIRVMGFSNVEGIVPGARWRGWEFTLAGGQHGPRAVLDEMGEVHGFVLRIVGEPTLYWVGDSVWCPAVRDTLDTFAPDAVVVHACGATWQGHAPLVMDADHVQALLRHAPSCRVIATHMDTVDHATVSRSDLARHFERVPQHATRLLIPGDGETVTIER